MMGFVLNALLISWIVCAITGGVISMNRGNGVMSGLIAGALFGVFGLAMAATTPRNPTVKEMRCKTCAEIVRREAKVCPHCHVATA